MSKKEEPDAKPSKPERLKSIDALRGMDMIWIIGLATVVKELDRWLETQFTHWLRVQMGHAKWDGFAFMDNPNVGYGGHDEDQGMMGSVSALMKIGLFSLRGTTAKDPIYEITAPEFDEVTINLDPRYYSGKTFTIKANNNAPENCYIQKAKLNGKALDNCWFYHSDFAKGGLLELWLGPKPNKQWGGIAPERQINK